MQRALERILGLTDEDFERYKYAERTAEPPPFLALIKVLTAFLKAPNNGINPALSEKTINFKTISERWYKDSRYSKILARDYLGNNTREQIPIQIEVGKQNFLVDLELRHKRALVEIPRITESGLFESVKDLLQTRMTEALFRDQKSEVGIGFRPNQMGQVRRFYIGIKEYLYMPLSEEELTFVRELNADAETDDASEVSTNYESSEWTDTDDEDEGSYIPWDDKDEDPIQQ